MEMVSCQFELNYGLNVGLGAAISINGMQDKVFQDQLVAQAAVLDPIRSKSLNRDDYTWTPIQKYGLLEQDTLLANARLINITKSTFTKNFAGQRASAINIIDVYGSDHLAIP